MNRYASEAREFLKIADVASSEPSLGEIERLIIKFARFPFENATKILSKSNNSPDKWQRRPDRVLSENISFGAGGTCFALTFFLKCILEHMGYDSYPVLCDRSYGPATHCALVALFEGKKYLIDPGYLLTKPVELPADPKTPSIIAAHGLTNGARTPNRSELVRLGDSSQYALITEGKNGPKLRYRFRNLETSHDEFEKCWMDSFGWPMMNAITLCKTSCEGVMFSRATKNKNGDFAPAAAHLSNIFGIDPGLLEEANRCLQNAQK